MPAVVAANKKRVLVLYGSETGTAEAYAYEMVTKLRSFSCHVSVGRRKGREVERPGKGSRGMARGLLTRDGSCLAAFLIFWAEIMSRDTFREAHEKSHEFSSEEIS